MSTSADARRSRDRAERRPSHCTVCSQYMSDNLRTWGLVWDSGIHGICVPCIVEIRNKTNRTFTKG